MAARVVYASVYGWVVSWRHAAPATRARTAVRESYSFLLAVMQERDDCTRVCVIFWLALQVYLEVYWWINHSHFKCIDMVICFVVRMEGTRRKTSSHTIVEAQWEEHKVFYMWALSTNGIASHPRPECMYNCFEFPLHPQRLIQGFLMRLYGWALSENATVCVLVSYVNKFFNYCYTSPLNKQYF